MTRVFKPLFALLLTATVWSGGAFAQCFSQNFGDYEIRFDGKGEGALYQKVNGKFVAAMSGKLEQSTEPNPNGGSTRQYKFQDSSGIQHSYTVYDKVPIVTKRDPKGDAKIDGFRITYGTVGKDGNAFDGNAVSYSYDATKKECSIFRQYDTQLKLVTYDKEFCAEMKKFSKDFEKSCKDLAKSIEKAVKGANARIENDHKGKGYRLDYEVDPSHRESSNLLYDQVMEAGRVCASAPKAVDQFGSSSGSNATADDSGRGL